MVPCDRRQRHAAGGLLWNPLAPLLGLASRLADGRQLSKGVQERAAALDKATGSRAAGKDAGGSDSGSSSDRPGSGASQASHASPSTGAFDSPTSSLASAAAAANQAEGAEQQYCLEDVPVRRILAGGAPPQLAWVPLRVALAMLHDLPQHFMLLQGALQGPKQQRPKQPPQQQGTGTEGRHKGRAGSHAQPAGTSQQPTAFTTVHSPAGMEVFTLPVSRGWGLLGGLMVAASRQAAGAELPFAPCRAASRYYRVCPPTPTVRLTAPLPAGPDGTAAHPGWQLRGVCARLPLRLPGGLGGLQGSHSCLSQLTAGLQVASHATSMHGSAAGCLLRHPSCPGAASTQLPAICMSPVTHTRPFSILTPQAQELLRSMQEMSGGAMLAYRRFERASMRRRLEAAAAVIATGGAAAGAPASGSMQVCGVAAGKGAVVKAAGQGLFSASQVQCPFPVGPAPSGPVLPHTPAAQQCS